MRYPSHLWDAAAKTTRRTRDHTTGAVLAEEVLASGLTYFEGTWRELPLVATRKAGSKDVTFVDTDGRPVKLFGGGYIKEHTKVRLVGDDGTIEAEGTAKGLAKKDPDDNVLRKSTMPQNRSPVDRAGLRVLVPDPTGVPAAGKPNSTTRRKMLLDGLESFDITAVCAFAVEDKAHDLLEPAHPTLVAHFKAIKTIRNDSWGHAVGGVVDVDRYRKDCGTLQRWAHACATARLLDPEDAERVATAIKQLDQQVYLAEGHVIDLATGALGELSAAGRRAITLTRGQAAEFGKLWAAVQAEGSRLLVQAPSGSGKTVICVKVGAQFLVEAARKFDSAELLRRGLRLPRPAPPPMPAAGMLLLLTHSTFLAEKMAIDLCVDLEVSCPGSWPKRQAITDGVFDVLLDSSADDAVVRVASIDGLVESIGRPADPSFADPYAGPKYNAVVVDEGHVVFSYQPEAHLHGQHHFVDPSKVRDLLEHTLKPGAPVVTFHDENYQLVGRHGSGVLPDAAVRMPYPVGSTPWALPLPIVRNTGAVRDISVPFSKTLSTWQMSRRIISRSHSDRHNDIRDQTHRPQDEELARQSGRQSYHPLLDEGTPGSAGKEVRFVDVAKARYRTVQRDQYQLSGWMTKPAHFAECGPKALLEESADQSQKYALPIITELEQIRRRLTRSADRDGNVGCWAMLVAVLVPGSPSTVATDLLAAVSDALNWSPWGPCLTSDHLPETASPPYSELAGALPATPGYGPTGLYFGPAENFAGLERPLVVVTGMQHPKYLVHRREVEGWQGEMEDPRVYLAVTRCTYELSVVEVEAVQFAPHFNISAAAIGLDGGAAAAEFLGDSMFRPMPSNAMVEGAEPDAEGLRYIRLTVEIDLAKPPRPAELKTAGVLSFKKITQQLWNDSSFKFSQCSAGVWELNLDTAFAEAAAKATKSNVDTVEMLVHSVLGTDVLKHLRSLHLSKNQLPSFTFTLGSLTALTELYLDDNRLTSIPDNIGNLTNLQVLRLMDNELESVPSTIGKLTALTRLGLRNNRLKSLPSEIGDLTALTVLWLADNMLETLPDIGKLAMLSKLTVEGNRLTAESFPGWDAPESKLTAIGFLHVARNGLESIPPAFLQLKGLVSLNLSQNPLASWPAGAITRKEWPNLGRLLLYDCPLVQFRLPRELHALVALGVAVVYRESDRDWSRKIGTVTKFGLVNQKGRRYGFIKPDGWGGSGSKDVYFDLKRVESGIAPQPGSRVSFRVVISHNGRPNAVVLNLDLESDSASRPAGNWQDGNITDWNVGGGFGFIRSACEQRILVCFHMRILDGRFIPKPGTKVMFVTEPGQDRVARLLTLS